MFCTKCGAQLPDDAVFCGACGCKLEPLVIETKEKVVNVVVSDEPPTVQKSSSTKTSKDGKTEEKAGKPIWKGCLGFLLPIVLVILLFGLVGLLSK